MLTKLPYRAVATQPPVTTSGRNSALKWKLFDIGYSALMYDKPLVDLPA
jgi:hypothetical protein